MTTLTNGTATEERYFKVNFIGYGDTYAYGVNATSAIRNALTDLLDDHRAGELGSASARPAVYGEWDCAPHHFHNDGTHSHNYGMEA